MSNSKFKFKIENLYAMSDGVRHPLHTDIQQDKINNCYFLASIQSLAFHNPEHIKNLIGFDAKTGDYSVRFFDKKTADYTHLIKVGQADIDDNIKRQGGSKLDNGYANAPFWPAVMEVAFAKYKNPDLNKGYKIINAAGSPKEAHDLLGIKDYSSYDAKSLKQSESVFVQFIKDIENAKAPALFMIDKNPGIKNPHLIEKHAYALIGIGKIDGRHVLYIHDPYQNQLKASFLKKDHTIALDLKETLHSDFWKITIGQGIHPIKKLKTSFNEGLTAEAVAEASPLTQVREMLASLDSKKGIGDFLASNPLTAVDESVLTGQTGQTLEQRTLVR